MAMHKGMYFVYVLRCADNTFYTGYTVDIKKRLEAHNSGKGIGAKYTRTRRPVTLVYQESYQTLSEALKRENQIKSLHRKDKERLIG